MTEVIKVCKSSVSKHLTILLAIILILSLTSCGENKNKQQSQNQQQKKDPPTALTEMETQTDNMIKQIQKVRDQRAQMIRLQADESQGQKDDGKKNESQQDSKKGQQKKEEQQDKGQNQNQAAQQKLPTIKWQDFEKSIKAINELWNSYEPRAKKDGAPDMLISKFEDQLNKLTNSIMDQNEEAVLLAANNLYQYYSQFLNLYAHKSPPEIKEIKYYLQQILIDAEAGTWDNTQELLKNMEKAWETAKSRMEKPNKELNEKIDYAVQDFSQAVQQKDLHLSKLKGEILLKNLEKIK